MDKKSCHRTGARIPLESDGIQVNFCKNPLCDNYGVVASVERQPRGPGAASRGRDNYKLSKKQRVSLSCQCCGESFPVKSNQAIAEEVKRFKQSSMREKNTCPNLTCSNQSIDVSEGKPFYQSFGRTKSGTPRYRCKLCSKTFSVKRATTGQKQPHKNKMIFKLLMNKSPFRRICEVADVSMSTVYNKIDFIHRQCQAFVDEKEHKLLSKHIERLYISVDRQEYVVNWSRRDDKRNVTLSAIGSADNQTGYVFGMHLNYDPSIDSIGVEADAVIGGDNEQSHAYRKHARLWLQSDYTESLKQSVHRKIMATGITNDITETYNGAIQRIDIESSEEITTAQQLPTRGMQVHSSYTMYGHFFYLHRLLGNVDKTRFFLDQDSGIRAACLSAFQKEVLNRSCDAFYVRLNKALTVDEKRRVLRESRRSFKDVQASHPELTEAEVKLMLIKQRMTSMAEIGQWKDRWLIHPFPNMSEPEKAICYLTDYQDYDEGHQAWIYNKASMHGIDCFFMQVRRRLSLLERPIASASSARRMWHGYSAYNPAVIVKLLDIFRVYYNYCLAGKDKRTPAMRIGLAKGKVPLEDIIYY